MLRGARGAMELQHVTHAAAIVHADLLQAVGREQEIEIDLEHLVHLVRVGDRDVAGIDPRPVSYTHLDVYKRQSVLWEAGADLILFETFTDLHEIEIGVRAARAVCDLPIVASMTFAEDGLTMTGYAPDAVAARLRAAGADVVGVNCSVGPASMLQTLEHFRAAVGDAPLIVLLNAGFPERVEGRFYYPSSPEYFARETAPFLDQGADIIGGCCGTTPMHIRAMRAALDEHLAARGRVTTPAVLTVETPLPAVRADYGVSDAAQPTDVLRKLRAGKFVISVEVDPPRSFTAEKQIEGARHALRMGCLLYTSRCV